MQATLTAPSESSGWPDLSIGWRNQIPTLLEMGYRVVAPDIMGFGRTDAPQINQPSDMAYYSFKRAADDIKELARQLNCETIIIGGHDWVSVPLSLSLSLSAYSPVSKQCFEKYRKLNETNKIKGRSHRLPHRPPPPLPHNPPLLNLHSLLAPHPNLHPPPLPRRIPHALLGLPAPPRQRPRRTAHPVKIRHQAVPQRRVRRQGTEEGGRLQPHEGAFVHGVAEAGKDAVDGGGDVGVLCGGV